MSGGALATVDDLAAVWRPLDADETAQATRLLELASSLVRRRVPGIDTRVDADTTFADVVAATVAGVALRVLVNPEGHTQRSEGPYSATFSSGTAGVGLYLSPADVATLAPNPLPGNVYSVPFS